MKKNIFILIVIGLLVLIGYKYVYHDHRNIEEETAEFKISSENLINAFSTNSSDAEKKYLNRTIEISGPVSDSNESSITLGGGVFCQFTNNLPVESPKETQIIKIKGRLIGYDDLLEEIKLDQCTIVN